MMLKETYDAKILVGPMSWTLTTAGGKWGQGRAAAWIPDENGGTIRTLTETEYERLMGWPDGHTAEGVYPGNGTWQTLPVPSTERYRMCGNGVAAPHAEWIGRRLLPIDKAMSSVGVAAADPAEDLAHP
jgi:hypothetical protein